MTPFLLRTLAWAVPLGLLFPAIAWRRPSSRGLGAALLSSIWAFGGLCALSSAATHLGWWTYAVDDALFLGAPIDLLVGWTVLWGPLVLLLAPRVPLWWIAAALAFLDLHLMPALTGVLILEDNWWIGEIVGLALVFVPAQLLGRLTWTAHAPRARATLHLVQFIAVILVLLPYTVLLWTGGLPVDVGSGPTLGIALQLLAIIALPGLSAVQEFAERGGGTPVPFDPPLRLVCTGPYAYVANPMQLSTALFFAVLGLWLGRPWVAGIGAMAVVFGAGFAAWEEQQTLIQRFGSAWKDYRSEVRMWIPRWTPYTSGRGRIYTAIDCGPCVALQEWLERRGPIDVDFVPAEPSMRRVTYEGADGSRVEGITAIARVLERVNLGWALVAMAARVPIANRGFQLLADAVGGGPRPLQSQ